MCVHMGGMARLPIPTACLRNRSIWRCCNADPAHALLPGDVDRLVSEALKLGSAETLVAAGGDGTVCEVVSALLQHTGENHHVMLWL